MGDQCVCSGDVPAVRTTCDNWVTLSQKVEQEVVIKFDSAEISRMIDEKIAELPSIIANPLSAYGTLVRALRIVAGVTLMDHAKTLAIGPAALSSLEFGRKQVDRSMVIKTAIFFAENGVENTQDALSVAASKSNSERLRRDTK
ncbi:DNA binding protein [Burkholderia phage BCSR52]|uniref:DNA binding protein n=1 Tax=Burkholderia phage BCSR52 TaxID=2805748 RepID=A0A889IQF6_9CAUD|nr:DNA binding protein [Burkholderia phage BCSR52]